MQTKLAAALVKVQAEVENPAFDSTNPHFRSKYASLLAVREAVIPVFNKHGISVIQFPVCESFLAKREETIKDSWMAGCETHLIHESGETMVKQCLLPLDKLNAHGAGSCITYARRYSLMAIAGVVGDEDDDANSAVDQDKGKITPSAGIKDTLTPKEQKRVEGVASSIIDCFEAYGMEGGTASAYKMIEEAKFNAEEKIYCWTFLDSKQRASIKKFAQQERELHPATQA